MRKSIYKPSFIWLSTVILISIFFLALITFRSFLMANKSRIENHLSNYLDQTISIEQIHYLPPVFIILKNISVSGNDQNLEHLPLFIEQVTFAFSLTELISNRSFIISKIYFTKPKIDLFNYPLFFKENIEKFIGIINFLARGRPIKIILEDTFCILERRGNIIRGLQANLKIQVDPSQAIKSHGCIKLCNFLNNTSKQMREYVDSKPLEYDFYGLIIPAGIAIERLNFDHPSCQADFKGKLQKNVLKLSGNAVINNFHQNDRLLQNKTYGFIKELKGFLMPGAAKQKADLTTAGINISEINSTIKFASKGVEIKNIDFHFNNIPVSVKADISFGDQTSIKVNLSTLPGEDFKPKKKNPRKINLEISAVAKKNRFSGNAQLDFAKFANKQQFVYTLKATFDNLSFGFLPDTRLKIFITQLLLLYYFDEKGHSFVLKDFDCLLNFINKEIKFVKFNSRMFDGYLRGHVGVDISNKPLKMNSRLSLRNVDAHELDSLLLSLFGAYRKLPAQLQSRVYGKFACNIDYELPLFSRQVIKRLKASFHNLLDLNSPALSVFF